MPRTIRVLIAKPGLDGHETGAKMVARALRDAGMEVIYTGPRQTAKMIVETAIQEAVDVIGLSILSNTYMHYCPQVCRELRDRGVADIPVILGGIINPRDIPKLEELGIKGIFGPGSSLEDIVDYVRKIGIEAKRER